jgi:hypothetical protein
MERGLPAPQFRLRPRHLFYLVDLAVAAAVFVFVGRYYADHKAAIVRQKGEQQQALQQQESERQLVQADSVMTATQARLSAVKEDSVRKVQELETKKSALEQGFVERQQLAEKLFRLSDAVLNMRTQSEEEVSKANNYESDVATRRDEITSLTRKADESDSLLDAITGERYAAAETLKSAYEIRTVEPVGMFPERSSLTINREMAENDGLTRVELQQVLLRDRAVDLGLSVGVGLGSGDRAAAKEVGLLLSRPLIHRRLGLDFGAGYSVLTHEGGNAESGAFARAGLRVSPFYKERFHFGIGARADHGEVLPYVGVSVGRR